MNSYESQILSNKRPNKELIIALLLSISLHAALVLLIQNDPKQKTSQPIEVTLLQPETKRQIVSPSELEESKPLETTKLSDKDTRAEQEQLRRGEIPKAPSPSKNQTQDTIPRQATPSKKETPQTSSTSNNLPNDLKLRDDQLLGQLAKDIPVVKQIEPKRPSDSQRQQQFQRAAPFQRAESSIFKQGNPDLLPEIRDGDLTLLNAKADRHAVFVRRVALQVFGILRSLSWQELSRSQINMLQSHTIIEAVMSPKGKLLSVTLKSGSGSAAFDKIVEKAAQEGTWDQNPPPSARAADGNIHFFFYSRSWSRVGGEALREQRWIMLGTGLL